MKNWIIKLNFERNGKKNNKTRTIDTYQEAGVTLVLFKSNLTRGNYSDFIQLTCCRMIVKEWENQW